MPKGVESFKYEGVSFNKKYAAGKTLAEFQEEHKHLGLSPEQLKEAWQLARGTKEVEDVSKGMIENVVEPEPVKAAPKKSSGK